MGIVTKVFSSQESAGEMVSANATGARIQTIACFFLGKLGGRIKKLPNVLGVSDKKKPVRAKI